MWENKSVKRYRGRNIKNIGKRRFNKRKDMLIKDYISRYMNRVGFKV